MLTLHVEAEFLLAFKTPTIILSLSLFVTRLFIDSHLMNSILAKFYVTRQETQEFHLWKSVNDRKVN